MADYYDFEAGVMVSQPINTPKNGGVASPTASTGSGGVWSGIGSFFTGLSGTLLGYQSSENANDIAQKKLKLEQDKQKGSLLGSPMLLLGGGVVLVVVIVLLARRGK